MAEGNGMNGTDIARLVARRRPDYALERAFYTDPALWERDKERLIFRHWLVAGHASQLPKPGDYRVEEIAGESVILARGADGQIRALANVCRHRGSRVTREACGNAKVFICPYHAWAYNLDGTLRAARHMPADFDAKAHGLKRLALREIEGVLLLSFAEKPLGLENVEAAIRTAYEPYGWARASLAHRALYPIKANWKHAVENYLECYHCAPAHPEYSELHALERPWEELRALNEKMDARAAAMGLAIPNIEDQWLPSSSGQEAVYRFRYPLYEGAATGAPEGKPVAPVMGRLNTHDGAVTSVHVAPASFLISYADHGVIYRFVPKTMDTSELEVLWLVREGAREGVDYDKDALTWMWRVTSEADIRITEDNYAGVTSRFYEPGPLAPMEPNLKRYLPWYLGEVA